MDGQNFAGHNGAGEPSPRENCFYPGFIPPARPEQMPGMWQRYYERWRVAARDLLPLDWS